MFYFLIDCFDVVYEGSLLILNCQFLSVLTTTKIPALFIGLAMIRTELFESRYLDDGLFLGAYFEEFVELIAWRRSLI